MSSTKTKTITDCEEYTPYHHKIRIYIWIYKNFEKGGITLNPLTGPYGSYGMHIYTSYGSCVGFRWLENCGRSLRHNISKKSKWGKNRPIVYQLQYSLIASVGGI